MAAAKGPRRKLEAAIDKAGPSVRDLRWWQHEKPHEVVIDRWKRIGKRTSSGRNRDVYYAALYDDPALVAAVQGHAAIGEFTPQTMATNIVRRQVDTFTAKISKNRPVPMGLTSAGNYSQQRRAKAISTFFEGILDQVGFWPTRTLRIRDGAIFGSGLALNYRVGRKIVHDRLFRREVRVCPIDAERGKPRTVLIGRRVDKLLLAERFPQHAEKIFSASSYVDDGGWKGLDDDELNATVFVVEAKHLPSSETSGDGAHAICIDNETLSIGEYKYDHFLLSKFDFSPPVAGWFGTGLASQLEGLQYEVNAVGMKMQERHYLMGSYVMREANSDVEYEQIDNGTMTEIVYSGQQPSFHNPPAVGSDLFNWWQTLRTQMPAEITGISGLSSRAEKPAGLYSGRALRTYHDIDTENLTPQGRADEDDVIATCWQFFDLAEEIYAETKEEPERGEKRETGPYVVKVESRKRGRSVLEEIDYGKVRLDRESFKLRTFPTNFLRGTPEEQIQSVNEMIEAGFLSQDEALILLDFPDLQRVLNLRTAARHIIERTLESFLEAEDPTAEGVYVYPEPPMGLELCKALAIMTYLEAKLDGASEANLKLVMDFYLDAKGELDRANAPPAEAAPGVTGAPPEPMPGDPGAMPSGPGGPLYAPPDQPLMPAGAVAPAAISALPPGAA